MGRKERKVRTWLKRSREWEYCKGRHTHLSRPGMCSRSAFLESEKARVLSKGLGFLEGSTKCHCDIVTALSHITNLFHSNLLFTGETKIWAFLPLRSPATCCQENSFLVLLGLLSRLHFLGKSAKRYQSRQEHPGTLICLEFNQMSPRHGIIYPTPGSAHFKNISERSKYKLLELCSSQWAF